MTRDAKVTGTYRVEKTDVPEQNVFGWFSFAAHPDGGTHVDLDGDVISPEELERASYQFVKEARVSGEGHDGGDPDGALIASIAFTDDIIDALSIDPVTREPNQELRKAMKDHMPRGWFGGFHLDSREAWDRVVSGELPEFSIEGTADRAIEVTDA